VSLLKKVIECGAISRDRLAAELVMTGRHLEAYLDETVPMPLDRQLCLALLVIERVPSLAREGHRLRGQVAAAAAFHGHVTETHAFPPPALRPR
jgi:hypothetical protein